MNFNELTAAAMDAVRAQVQRAIAFLPNLGAALLLILLGWLAARLVRAVTARIAASALSWLERKPLFESGVAKGPLREHVPAVVGRTAFWIVLLIFFAAAVDQLDLTAVSDALSELARYAPQLLAALLITAAGFVLSGVVHHWLAATLAPAGANQAQMLARLAQFATLAIAIIMAADQAGIHSTVLMVSLGIVLTAALGGVALAFAIGCGPIVANIVASHYISKRFEKGRVASVGQHSGAVNAVTSTFVVLETEDGEILIPARRFLEEASVLRASGR